MTEPVFPITGGHYRREDDGSLTPESPPVDADGSEPATPADISTTRPRGASTKAR